MKPDHDCQFQKMNVTKTGDVTTAYNICVFCSEQYVIKCWRIEQEKKEEGDAVPS